MTLKITTSSKTKFLKNILKKPIFTKKGIEYLAENKYSFVMHKNCSKDFVKSFFEKVLHLRPRQINSLNCPSSSNSTSRINKRKRYKKFIIKF